MRPLWHDLPFRFKQNVIDKLDFRSRVSLQKCSQSDRNLVKSVPFFMSSMLLNLSPDSFDGAQQRSSSYEDTDISDNEERACDGLSDDEEIPEPKKTELLIMEKPLSKGLYWRTEPEDSTIKMLKTIVSHSNLAFRDFIFTKDGNPSRFIGCLLEQIEENQKFRIRKLTWTCIEIARTQEEIENCLRFFQLCDTDTLRKLELNFSHKHFIRKLMKTEQFQNLKEIFINSEIENEDIENLLHAEKIKVRLEEVVAKDMKKIIEVFLNKKLGCFFKISTNESQIELDELLAMFKTMPNNSSVPTNSFYERDTNTHRFEIIDRKTEKGEELVLYMKIRRNDLWGVVCRAEHVIKDFSVCPYY